ncbi:hypothetical protein HN011_010083 [Eciton burchellii]|nr:hypothetical protein HN011_010083 [Eciton burchellii]
MSDQKCVNDTKCARQQMCSNKCIEMARDKCDMPRFCSKRMSELYPSVSWILFYDTTSTTNERIAYASNAISQIHRNPKYISSVMNHHSRDSKNNLFSPYATLESSTY